MVVCTVVADHSGAQLVLPLVLVSEDYYEAALEVRNRGGKCYYLLNFHAYFDVRLYFFRIDTTPEDPHHHCAAASTNSSSVVCRLVRSCSELYGRSLLHC